MHKQAGTYNGPISVKQAFTHGDTHPLVFSIILLRTFGPEVLAWEPETCWAEIMYTWGTTTSDINKQKIQGIRACYVADRVYTDWEIFEKVCAGLVGVPPLVAVGQRPTAARLALTLDTLQHVRDTGVAAEIHKYCAAVLMDHGMVYGPGLLEPANEHVKNIDETLQAQVRAAVENHAVPNIASNTVFDVQLMKSLSVADFAATVQQKLVAQSALLFGK